MSEETLSDRVQMLEEGLRIAIEEIDSYHLAEPEEQVERDKKVESLRQLLPQGKQEKPPNIYADHPYFTAVVELMHASDLLASAHRNLVDKLPVAAAAGLRASLGWIGLAFEDCVRRR